MALVNEEDYQMCSPEKLEESPGIYYLEERIDDLQNYENIFDPNYGQTQVSD